MIEPKGKLTPADDNGGHKLSFTMDHHGMEFKIGQYVQGSYHVTAAELREVAARFIFAAEILESLSSILSNEFEPTEVEGV